MHPAPIDPQSQHPAGNQIEDRAVQKGKEEAKEQSRQVVLDIDPRSKRSCGVTNDRVGNTVDPDGPMREPILHESNEGTHEGGSDRAAAQDREIDRHQQRKIEDGKPREMQRDEGLQANRQQRDHKVKRYGVGPGIDFPPGTCHERGQSYTPPGGVVAGCGEL